MVLSFPSLPIAADIKTNQKPTPFTIRRSRFQGTDKQRLRRDLSVEEDNEKKKCRLAEIGRDQEILILGLKSLVAVFKDIIPGLPTDKELAMVVSKDVRKTHLYESTLLNVYKVR
ncbi:nucleolar complex protein 3 [Tanacetum coccineum]